MKFIDIIGIVLIIVGIMMTAVNFFAVRGGPSSEVIGSSIQEIKPEPPVHKHLGQPI
jgi:hypothetical protein